MWLFVFVFAFVLFCFPLRVCEFSWICELSNWRNFSHYFFKYFFDPISSSPSGTPIIHMLHCLILSFRSLKLCLFIFSVCFLSLFQLNNFYFYISISLILSSKAFNLWLNYSREVFISDNLFFNFRCFLISLFLIIFISPIKPLSIFMITVLRTLNINATTSVISGSVSIK